MYSVMRTLMAVFAQWNAQILIVLPHVMRVTRTISTADTARHFLDSCDVHPFFCRQFVVYASSFTRLLLLKI
jgi:hypothetical protein